MSCVMQVFQAGAMAFDVSHFSARLLPFYLIVTHYSLQIGLDTTYLICALLVCYAPVKTETNSVIDTCKLVIDIYNSEFHAKAIIRQSSLHLCPTRQRALSCETGLFSFVGVL